MRYIKLRKFKRKNILTTIGTISLVGAISIGAYNFNLNNKLNKIEINEEKIESIKESYDDQISIFVMNDSQGMNLNFGFWKNSYEEYLEESLDANLIDASSLKYNKTSHIDMLLNNNLTLEEMKELTNEGNYIAIRNLTNDINIPSFVRNIVGKVGESIFYKRVEENDKNIHITDYLKDSNNPIVIYSSGANDLMFLGYFNPASINKYNKDGKISDEYLYTINMLSNPDTTNNVINNIENNFKNILSINPNSKLVVLSIYVPKSMDNDEYIDIINAINYYNKKLYELCIKYNAVYIDEEDLLKVYNEDNKNFHINEVGHKVLAAIIIDELSQSKENTNIYINNSYNYDNKGLNGYYSDLVNEIEKIEINNDDNDYDYSLNVYIKQVNEKIEDASICKKLILENKN